MRPTIENIVNSKNKVMEVFCKNGRCFIGYIYIMADDPDEVYIEDREGLTIAHIDQIAFIEEA